MRSVSGSNKNLLSLSVRYHIRKALDTIHKDLWILPRWCSCTCTCLMSVFQVMASNFYIKCPEDFEQSIYT